MSAAFYATILLSVLAGPGSWQEGQPDDPYPYEYVPVDALRGHLMEGYYKEPVGVFFDHGPDELYVADMKNGLIGIYEPDGTPLFNFGGRPLLLDPSEVFVTPDGTIYVLDGEQREIKVFSYRGEPRQSLGFPYPAVGEREPGVARVGGFAIGETGWWYVADLDQPQVLVYDSDLKFQFAIPGEDELVSFSIISGIAVSREGLIAVLDFKATPVQVFDSAGRFISSFGSRGPGRDSFTAPADVTFDEEGYLYVVDMLRHDVRIFDVNGVLRGAFGGWYSPESGGRAPGELLYPTSIALGRDHRAYVAERFGNRVQLFDRRPRREDRGRPRLRIPDVIQDE